MKSLYLDKCTVCGSTTEYLKITFYKQSNSLVCSNNRCPRSKVENRFTKEEIKRK